MPTGTLTGHTYLHRPRLNDGHCLGENATLKLLIEAEQSPEGARVRHRVREPEWEGGRERQGSEAL